MIRASLQEVGAGRSILADAYGSPWEVVRAFAASKRERPASCFLVATDGLGDKLRVSGGVNVLKPFVEKYGDAYVRRNYKQIAREVLSTLAGEQNLRVKDWHFHDSGKRLCHWTAEIASA